MNKMALMVFSAAMAASVALADGWSAAGTFYGLVSDDSGAVGVVTVKNGKEKKGKVKVSASVSLGGKTYSYKAKAFDSEDPIEVELTNKKLGDLALSLSSDGTFTGTLDSYDVESVDGDAALEEGDELSFSLVEEPTEIKGYSVYSEFLPSSVPITVGKKGKLILPKAGKVKWSGEYESLVCVVREDGELVDSDNPGALKLSYSPKTGKFSGSFKVYLETSSEKKAKALTFKVTGFIIGGVGTGTAYNSKYGSVAVEIQ